MPTIFLRDITCLNRRQVILKLYKNAKIRSMIIQLKDICFQKAKPLWTVAFKIRTDQPGQMEQSEFSLKYLKQILVTLFSINLKKDKLIEGIAKKSLPGTE